MSGPFRLPATTSGRFGAALDRSEPVGFRVGGRVYSGFYGDTLASALLASGVERHGASSLLGRPRGLLALGLEDALPVSLEGDGGAFAAISADEIVLREGLKARGQDDRVRRALRRFAPTSLPDARALPLAQIGLERLRRALPLPGPRLPKIPQPPDIVRDSCDVVVVGAGLAGLAAAAAVRAAGLEVRVLEASHRTSGLADLYDGRIDGRPLAAWAAAEAGALQDRRSLTTRATVIDVAPDGSVTAIERIDPQRPGRVALRLISAGAVVLATGFRERPLVFPDNDRPGIMLATTARALLRRHAVAPGARALVATAGDEGYRAAMDLRQAGVAVELVLDPRSEPEGTAIELAKALGAPLSLSTVVTGVEYDLKAGRLIGVRTRNRHGEGASAGARVLPTDALIVSGGFVARDELARASGLGPDNGVHVAHLGPNAVDAVAGGWAAGSAAVAGLGAGAPVAAPPSVDASADAPAETQELGPANFRSAGAASAFVDFGADVTLADLDRAVERRGAAPQAIARRLGLGLGADGGRLSADLPALALTALAGDAPDALGPGPVRATLGLMAARAEAAG